MFLIFTPIVLFFGLKARLYKKMVLIVGCLFYKSQNDFALLPHSDYLEIDSLSSEIIREQMTEEMNRCAIIVTLHLDSQISTISFNDSINHFDIENIF